MCLICLVTWQWAQKCHVLLPSHLVLLAPSYTVLLLQRLPGGSADKTKTGSDLLGLFGVRTATTAPREAQVQNH